MKSSPAFVIALLCVSSAFAGAPQPEYLKFFDPAKGFKPAQRNLTDIYLQIAGSLECYGSPEPYMKKKMAVRVCAEALSDPDLDVQPGMFGKALADMNIKGAPYTNKTRQQAMTPEGIAKWKEWYETNKAAFAPKAAAPAPPAPPPQQ